MFSLSNVKVLMTADTGVKYLCNLRRFLNISKDALQKLSSKIDLNIGDAGVKCSRCLRRLQNISIVRLKNLSRTSRGQIFQRLA